VKGFPAYLLFRFLTGILGWMPHPVISRGGSWLGLLLSRLANRRMALLRRHMRRVLGGEATEEEVTEAAREMFASYGRYWAEVFWFRPRRKEWAIRNTVIDGKDPVVAAQEEGRGVILAVTHLGNWEVAAPVADSIGLPVLSVAEELPNRRITDWFIATRAGFDTEIVIAGRGSTMSALVNGIRRGKAVALVADRDVTGSGAAVVFFGEETTMPTGPAALAELTGAAIFPVGTYFEGDGFRLVAHPELKLDATVEDRKERIRRATQQLAESFEEIIRAAPTQWHLFQPNWPSDHQEAPG
jgi:phosphatidylinositol dimannoside acyltransferase